MSAQAETSQNAIIKGGVAIGDVRLRPHHALCIQGFRGQGYSPAFIANFARVADRLERDRDAVILIVDGADDICQACPHLISGACALPDQNVDELDTRVLKQLEIESGSVTSWVSLQTAIGRRLSVQDFNSLCGACRWRDFGYCADGIARLASGRGQS